MAADETSQVKLVVGLGNPGRKYQNTKHNIGFEVLAELAQRHFATTPRIKFDGELCEVRIEGRKTLLLAPQTYMNRSGFSVQPARDFFKLSNADVLIICDDFALELGRLRFRKQGSAGGQKGLNDVIQRIGSDVPRLRVGIGAPPDGWDIADYVLSKFSAEERTTMDESVKRAAKGVADWVSKDIQFCMNHYNANHVEK